MTKISPKYFSEKYLNYNSYKLSLWHEKHYQNRDLLVVLMQIQAISLLFFRTRAWRSFLEVYSLTNNLSKF